MGKPEASVEQYLVKKAKARGWRCDKYTSPSNAGVPDRVLIGNGYTIFIETKAPGEKPRPLQKAVARDMMANGAIVMVIDTREQVNQLMDLLESLPVLHVPYADELMDIGCEWDERKKGARPRYEP